LFRTLGRVNSDIPYTAKILPDKSWLETIVSDRSVMLKLDPLTAEVGTYRVQLHLEGVDPEFNYESFAEYDLNLIVK
jgi:hypothetical protein